MKKIKLPELVFASEYGSDLQKQLPFTSNPFIAFFSLKSFKSFYLPIKFVLK